MRKSTFFCLILLAGLVFALCCLLILAMATYVWAESPGLAPLPPKSISSREAREVRVFLKIQHFGFYEGGRLVFWGPVCTGKPGSETPQGRFRVLLKAKGYVSKKFDAPMPFAIQFSREGHFLHEGEIRYWPSSHGCVRLGGEDAERVYKHLRLRDAVTIVN